MAAATLTPSHARFGASFTGSVARNNIYATDSVSMADSLPSIDFGFEELRDRMAQFTARFDEFIERGRKRVLEERNQFRLSVAEVQESQRSRKRDIETVENRSTAHNNSVAKEQQERDEMQTAISELSARREDHLARRDELKAQIADVHKAIHVRRQAQHQHQRQLDNQAQHNGPELQFWESSLCLRIEGVDAEDYLKFIYTHVDDKDWDRECCFVLNMSMRQYEITTTAPVLEREAVQAMLDRLNETQELASFLKGMRALFTDCIKRA